MMNFSGRLDNLEIRAPLTKRSAGKLLLTQPAPAGGSVKASVFLRPFAANVIPHEAYDAS
ncbi:hypothetical protein SAMCCGM7_pB0135 (plasmid) [Sinorhizobium americanum CCGM7]|nr:hypothetical protein SAMCCGM7_pB0135 [Sinorhizobium americanum CCGM7]